MKTPKAMVISGDGINCESETIYGLQLAGFNAQEVHITRILSRPSLLSDYNLIVFPGGFSFGDEIASGKVLAIKLMERLKESLYRFIEQDRLVIGICNGFQALVQMSLLPEVEADGVKVVSLLHNEGGRFINKWVALEVPAQAQKGYFKDLERIELPIRHGEGRIFPLKGKEELVDSHGTLRYVDNVNGSFKRIAALTNSKGNVMGLMPHPEAFVRFSQHPAWTEMAIDARRQTKAEPQDHAVPLGAEDHDEVPLGAQDRKVPLGAQDQKVPPGAKMHKAPDGLAILKNAFTMATE